MRFKLPQWDLRRLDVVADMALLDSLTKDMESSSKSFHKPASWWMLPQELVKGTIADLMAPWCGDVGQLPLSDLAQIVKISGSADLIAKYEYFLRSIDHQNLLQGITLQELGARNWRFMDLGSLMDLLFISAFYDFSSARHKILEVGGGFGRLAEFMSLATDAKIQYVNVDAVPVSLMYSYQYLRHHFPEKKVQIFSSDSTPDEDFDFLIFPAWHLDKFSLRNFDLCVNIESMQEMNQELVDFYLKYFDNAIKTEGLIYLVNSREYKFKGDWNIPENWQCMLRHRTPRSWTANHPAEMFRKTEFNQNNQNMLRTAFFNQELSCLESLKTALSARPSIGRKYY